MIDVLIAVIIIIIIGSAIAGLVYYVPFLPSPARTWVMWVVGALVVIAVLVQLLRLMPGGVIS